MKYAYTRFNYRTQRFEEYVHSNGQKLYQIFMRMQNRKIIELSSSTDGDPTDSIGVPIGSDSNRPRQPD